MKLHVAHAVREGVPPDGAVDAVDARKSRTLLVGPAAAVRARLLHECGKLLPCQLLHTSGCLRIEAVPLVAYVARAVTTNRFQRSRTFSPCRRSWPRAINRRRSVVIPAACPIAY
jgi:hypothetical protein